MRTMTINEAIEYIRNSMKYTGFRGMYAEEEELFERGYLNCSYVWDDGECTDEELSGTCAVGISDALSDEEIIARAKDTLRYYGDANKVLLIEDEHQEYGADENEVILGHNGYGADIVAIVEL